MNDQLDTLIALNKEYIRLLEKRKDDKQNNVRSNVTEVIKPRHNQTFTVVEAKSKEEALSKYEEVDND